MRSHRPEVRPHGLRGAPVPHPRRIFSDPAGPDYNIPPDRQPLAMHQLAGEFEVERLPWGWRPNNSKYLMPDAIKPIE